MSKVALITGAGRGIGYGIAKCLAKDGVNIAVMDVHAEDAVAENMQGLRDLGVEVLYCRGDITKADDRNAALDAVEAKFGELNILVNNAGVAPRVRADILEASEESYDFVMNINLKGSYFLTQAAANRMVKSKNANADYQACIINISSMSATVASPSRGEYCISKAGISMATRLWATRLGEFDIPVYEIRPGVIKTDMTAVVTEKYDKLIAEGLCLQKRWGYPEDIGRAVAMMARGDIAYSTGQVIMVDGGATIPKL
jgi:NAD(P)-dependent dehydrogenase (short-subunit alcohol dehydrogenase family)